MEQEIKMQRREKMTITTDILQALEHKQLKVTHLLYKSNLSYPRLQHYLGQLMDKGMVETVSTKGGRKYSITSEGRSFRRHYTETMEDYTNMGL